MVVEEPGGPEVLRVRDDVPEPTAGAGEVLLDVVATAVNHADLLQRAGSYPPPPGASELLGLECSGRVAALGEGTEDAGWSVGDEVCALLAGGGYAERVAVPVGQLLGVPRGLSLREAAALPEVACTVWSTVLDVGRLQAGERFLVHGGSGGIGTFAVQLAAARGAWVATTVGTREKAERVAALGADLVVVHTEEDFAERVAQVTEGAGIDVVLDHLGGPYLERDVASLATGGRLVVIGVSGGRYGQLDLGRLLVRRASVSAATLRSRPRADKARIVAGVAADVVPLVEDGLVRVLVDRVLPLEEAAAAHEAVSSRSHVGKVVLSVTGE